MSDSYRPRRRSGKSYPPRASRYKDRDAPPPPPPERDLPPRPRNSPPPIYRFKEGDSYRPNHGTRDSYYPSNDRYLDDRIDNSYSHRGDRRDEFTFRSAQDGPRSAIIKADSTRPHRRSRQNAGQGYNERRGRGGYFRPIAPHERPLLQSRRDRTPEQMQGMADGSTRFLALEDVSESEADMEMESETEESAAIVETNGDTPTEDGEFLSRKKTRVDAQRQTDGDSVPKWSNPDPYTVLPPPDETQAKKKDVVQLIRKAKVIHTEKAASTNPVADNDDFISFNFGDEVIRLSSDDEPALPKNTPTGPAHFSHRNHLHPERSSRAPGATAPSVNPSSLGPPPSDIGNPVPPPPKTPPPPPPTKGPSLTGSLNQIGLTEAVDVWPPPDIRAVVNTYQKGPYDTGFPPPPQQQGTKRKREQIDGRIVQEWIPQDRKTATPWCTVDHSHTEKMGYWLHKEICDFYEFVKPQDYEHSLRSELITRISKCLTSGYPNGQVHCFGSFAAGLYLPTADLDLVFVSNSFHAGGEKVFGQSRKDIRKIGEVLRKSGITQYDSMEFILGAKVPIIKFVDRITGLKVDMSFEKLDGLITNKTFQVWKTRYPVMPTLVTLVKHFLLMRGLNEVVSGGLGGFSVTCLVVSMIQQMPAVQSKNMDPAHNLGDLFMNFLDLYGNKFNLTTTRICMDPAGFAPKGPYNLGGNAREKPNRLSIIDPNAQTNDISRGSHKVELVFKLFSESYKMLQQRMAKLQTERTKNASILETIFAGNYSSFQRQRYHLHTLHRNAIEPTKRRALSEIDPNMNCNEDLADLKQLQQEKGMIAKLQAERQSLRYRPSSDMIRAQHFKRTHLGALVVPESLSHEDYQTLAQLAYDIL